MSTKENDTKSTLSPSMNISRYLRPDKFEEEPGGSSVDLKWKHWRSLSKEQVRCACSYKSKDSKKFKKPDWLDEYNSGKEYVPSYNIAPTEITPVLVSAYKYVEQAAPTDRALKPMMWGIIPPWHKGDYKAHKLSTNNCRLENIETSKLYNPILRKGGRCVVVVEGFYEWQTTKKVSKIKQPYYIYPPQDSDVQESCSFNEEEGYQGIKLLHMAGLYNQWQNDDTIIYSYSVITMESNSLLNWLHHRMPAILETQEQIGAWLNTEDVNPDMAISLLHPVKILSWHQVSPAVNNSNYKSSDCNKKITAKKNKSSQKTLTTWLKADERKRKFDNAETTTPKKFKNE